MDFEPKAEQRFTAEIRDIEPRRTILRTYENKDELKNEINKVKIIFFDIDGTLLEIGKTEITPNTRKALCSLKQNGIKICIATGRPFVTIPMFEGIVFDAILAFNGSFCVAGNQVVAKCPIPKEDIEIIIENAKRMERPVSIATAEEIVANGSDKDLEDYFAIAHHRVNVSEKFEEYVDKDVFQIMLGCDLEERKYILKGTKNAKLAAWWDRAIDIIPKEGGKGAAIEQVLAHYKFSKEEAIAFGDGENDMDMLLSVGKGIAMGNASEKVKEIATDICESVTDDGIYYYLKSQKIINE